MTVDMAKTIIAKSDQVNSDDLMGGPMTITVTAVKGSDNPDQPVSIHFEGDEGKPYKPCKTCRRILVHCWGVDAAQYIGRRMTLYRDDSVQFGGMKVGGIRISHLSHIERDVTMSVTATRAKKVPVTVKPLRAEVKRAPMRDDGQQDDAPRNDPPTSELTLAQRADAYEQRIKAAPSTVKLKAIRAAGEKLRADLDAKDPERLVELEETWNARFAEREEAERAGE